MAKHIKEPSVVEAAGNLPKRIEEFVGRVNNDTSGVSVALMTSPAGWVEPGQRPGFTEVTLVLGGTVHVETEDETFEVAAGEAIILQPGEWVRYSTPAGARYVAVCVPAFSPDSVHRDE